MTDRFLEELMKPVDVADGFGFLLSDARAGRRKGEIRFSPAQRSARWRARNPEKVAAYDARHPRSGETTADMQRRWYANLDAVTRLLTNAERRARARGLEFDLTFEDLLPLPTHCPVLGTELIYGATGRAPRNRDAYASLDRRDNGKGYVHGNVDIISWRANTLKSDGTASEHAAIALWMDNGVRHGN